MSFSNGDKVEICSKEEGFLGSYYAATVITKVSDDSYRVVYKNLLEEDESRPLIEMVSFNEIRPQPKPQLASRFSVSDKVDAFDNDGWWVGDITRRSGNMYSVYFHTTGDEIIYPLYRLRNHLDWVNGKWVSSSRIRMF